MTTSLLKICLKKKLIYYFKYIFHKKSLRGFAPEALGYLHTIRDMAVNLMNDIVCFCLVKNVNLIKKTASISTGSFGYRSNQVKCSIIRPTLLVE